jgi:hypothetical protein
MPRPAEPGSEKNVLRALAAGIHRVGILSVVAGSASGVAVRIEVDLSIATNMLTCWMSDALAAPEQDGDWHAAVWYTLQLFSQWHSAIAPVGLI